MKLTKFSKNDANLLGCFKSTFNSESTFNCSFTNSIKGCRELTLVVFSSPSSVPLYLTFTVALPTVISIFSTL